MPIPFAAFLPLIGAGIQTGANIFTNQSNLREQRNINNQNIAQQNAMYQTQRRDALTDRAFENEYNSPASQMERLKAAGLNPNLVYGNGAAQAPSVKTQQSSFGNPSSKAAQVNYDMSAIMDAIMMTAQLNKIKADTKLTEEQAKTQQFIRDEKESNINFKNSQSDAVNLQNSINRALAAEGVQTSQARANLDKTLADVKVNLSSNELNIARTSTSIKEALERIMLLKLNQSKSIAETERIRAVIQSIKQDIDIKQADVNAAKLGVSKSSNSWLKLIANYITSINNLEP